MNIQHCENHLHKEHKRDNSNWLYSYNSNYTYIKSILKNYQKSLNFAF